MTDEASHLEDLVETKDMFQDLANSITDVIFALDEHMKYIFWNVTCEQVIGIPLEEAKGKSWYDLEANKGYEWIAERYKDVLRTKQATTFEAVFGQGEHSLNMEINVYPSSTGIVVYCKDITATKRAEQALKQSEERYRNYVTHSPYGVFVANEHGRYLDVNPAACRITGYSEQELLEMSIPDLLPEAGREDGRKHFQTVSREGQSHGELPFVRKSGEKCWWTVSAVKLSDTRFLGFTQDITDRKRSEEEREKLQAQLTQAQKMESVGRLAGGVAHDFNNMLNVILGNTEMALEELDPTQPLHLKLMEIRKATERSTDLTRQLLAFARKQTVAPKVLDLNETVGGMINMLSRLIGEDIDLAWRPAKDLWSILMDMSQIDQILANLFVNARDAIVDVGKVTIETDNVAFDEEYCADHLDFTPGEYVLLAVSDDGHGMDKETLARLFEPFFTTKALGVGTGLGLATVYGIVRQNKGLINVYSEPGRGTCFKIYLPRHAGKKEPFSKTADSVEPVKGGTETILLVEDEPSILDIAIKMLKQQGYIILAARTPGEAIRMAREYSGRIDLLLTDVVMPEMNGSDMAKNIMSLYPDIKLLFMSGYTANVIAHHGVLEESVHFIQKPFHKKDLTAKVREVLDQE